MGGIHAMRYLAVPEMPRHRGFWALIRHWGLWAPEWHAVADTIPTSTRTVCGSPYTSEAYRTWGQTMSGDRCLQCERMVADAATAEVDTFIAGEAS
jgi:hypothetical protein